MKKIFTVLIFLLCFYCNNSYAQVKTYVLNNKNYVNAVDFALEFNFNIKWDSAIGIFALDSQDLKIKFMGDENEVLINNEICILSNKILLIEKGMFIPYEFMGKIRRKINPIAKNIVSKPFAAFEKKSKIKTIVIDAGHGGKDPGAVGKSGLQEKNLVLDIALKLKKICAANGYKVIMTRQSDMFIPLWMRSKIANKAKADLFISIHANAAKDRSAKGAEIFYLSDAMDDYSRSIEALENASLTYEDKLYSSYSYNLDNTKKAIWDLTCDEYRRESIVLSKYILQDMCNASDLEFRKVKCARFYVLKHTMLPSILVEVGFLSNASDEKKIARDSVRTSISKGIFKGIQRYSKEFERTNGFSN
jgi:N-acetylmuramoyl-L-alanine amidase